MKSSGAFRGERIKAFKAGSRLETRILEKPGFTKKYALVMTYYGSIDNDFSAGRSGPRRRFPEGIAHFLEHKMFEKATGDLTDKFAAVGGTTNAMTSFESTAYYVECAENFEENLRLLLELVLSPYFTQELVEKEKGIIAQEIRMYEDDPSWRGGTAVMKNLFGKHPAAIDIAGTVASIKKIRAEHLAECHRVFYTPSNLMLIVAGDVDAKVVDRIAGETLKKFDPPKAAPVKRFFPTVPARVKRHSEENWRTTTPKYFAGWRVDVGRRRGPKLLDLETALDVYVAAIFSRSGELFTRLFSEGLIDDSFSASVTAEKDFAMISFSSDTPDPERLETELLDGLRDLGKDRPAAEELRRTRRFMYGRFIRGWNSLESAAWNIAECHGKGVDYLTWGERLMALSDAEIRKLGRAAFAEKAFTSHVLLPAGK